MSTDSAFELGVVDGTEHRIKHTSMSGSATTHVRKDLP